MNNALNGAGSLLTTWDVGMMEGAVASCVNWPAAEKDVPRAAVNDVHNVAR